jgi:hypothetical protein
MTWICLPFKRRRYRLWETWVCVWCLTGLLYEDCSSQWGVDVVTVIRGPQSSGGFDKAKLPPCHDCCDNCVMCSLRHSDVSQVNGIHCEYLQSRTLLCEVGYTCWIRSDNVCVGEPQGAVTMHDFRLSPRSRSSIVWDVKRRRLVGTDVSE